MTEKKADAKKVEEKVAAKDQTIEKPVKVDIIRGRMPLPIVHMIKFADKALTDGALATTFRTTNGKVSDIRKDRNFGYIKEDYAPSGEMLDKAKEYAGQLEDKTVTEALNAMAPATDEQNKAFDEARKASRPGRKKSAKTEPAKTEEETPVTDAELEGLTE